MLLSTTDYGAVRSNAWEEVIGIRDKLAGDDLQGDELQGAAGRDAISAANDVAKAEELKTVTDWISKGNPNCGNF